LIQPKVVCQTDLPHANMRSNSLETCGNMMAVAYQTTKKDMQPITLLIRAAGGAAALPP
jgi:hypothetical protein